MNVIPELKFLGVYRAVSDLRLGIPVIIDQKYLIIAAETIKKDLFNQFRLETNNLFLIMSSLKAFFGSQNVESRAVYADISECSFENFYEIENLKF